WTVLLASTCLATTWSAPPVALEGTATSAKEGLVRELKNTVLEGDKGTGYIVSSCQVEGDRVYVAAARQQGAENYGILYCLDANTLKELWKFDNDGEMLEVFCSPTLAGGKLYIGEGFHNRKSSLMYCLDAKTGKLDWKFQTTSHTESTPVVAGGKVYFG